MSSHSQEDSSDLSSCDVFLSYESTPEADGFVSHLQTAFRRKGIKIFKGQTASGSEAEAIIKIARICIIIFSEEYARSSRCLEEMVEIQRSGRERNLRRFYFPVYYHVSRHTLEKLTESEELKKLRASNRSVSDWREALHEALGEHGLLIQGFEESNDEQEIEPYEDNDELQETDTTSTRNESDLVDAIVAEVAKRLRIFVRDPKLIGVDVRMEQVLTLLSMESNDIKFCSVGIWGMVGIGKTTIADQTFKRISARFEVSYFGRDLSKELRGKERYYLLDDFLSTVLGGEIKKSTFAIKPIFLKNILQNKSILVVLDDVDYFRDVELLVELFEWFGPRSRVIITSRNRQVLNQCMVNRLYEFEGLNEDESCDLLCLHVFGIVQQRAEHREQLTCMGQYAGGNPLIIQALGSIFRGKPVNEWDKFLNFSQPEAFKLLESFRRSYDQLSRYEKKIFLDIACFFKGRQKDHFADFLDECGSFTDIGISMLLDKSFVTLSSNDIVEMHTFIQMMGQEIVKQESEEPGRRSRLWNTGDIIPVLRENKGTEVIEGIFLEEFEATRPIHHVPGLSRLTCLAFERMSNLRLLKIYGPLAERLYPLDQPGGLDFISCQLRLLHWEFYPFESLPHSFESKNLVELSLPCSKVVKLCEGTMDLEKLKKINLKYSKRLIKIPNLSTALNLRSIDLQGCYALHNFNSVIGNLPENLKALYLGFTSIREVPSSIENVAGLVVLDLKCCGYLEILPSSISKLKYLKYLNLFQCGNLERFPNISEPMENLAVLDLTDTAIKELPPSLSRFKVSKKIMEEDKPMVRASGKKKEQQRPQSPSWNPFKRFRRWPRKTMQQPPAPGLRLTSLLLQRLLVCHHQKK